MSDYINCQFAINPKLVEATYLELKSLNTNILRLQQNFETIVDREDAIVAELSRLRAQVAELQLASTSQTEDDLPDSSACLESLDSAFDRFLATTSDSDCKQMDRRVRNCLRRSGVYTVQDLRYLGPRRLKKVRNLGKKTREVVELFLAYLGISFDTSSPDPDYEILQKGDLVITLCDNGDVPAGTVLSVKEVYKPNRYAVLHIYTCTQHGHGTDLYSISQLRKL